MSLTLKDRTLEGGPVDLAPFVPPELLPLDNPQTDIPRIAKDEKLIRLIEDAVRQIPTTHALNLGDARGMNQIEAESVHLVVTSPPYWTLKEYRDSDGQMGHIGDYEEFLTQLDRVWSHCFRALVPGGRLIALLATYACHGARTTDVTQSFLSTPRFRSTAASSDLTISRQLSGTR